MVNALSFDSSNRSSHTRSHTFSFISWRNVSYFSTLYRTAFIIEPMRKIPKDFQRIVDSDLNCLGNQNLPIAKESALISGAAKESRCRREVVPSSLRSQPIVSGKFLGNRVAWLCPTASIRKSAQVRSSLRKRASIEHSYTWPLMRVSTKKARTTRRLL